MEVDSWISFCYRGILHETVWPFSQHGYYVLKKKVQKNMKKNVQQSKNKHQKSHGFILFKVINHRQSRNEALENHLHMETTAERKIFYRKTSYKTMKESLIDLDSWQELGKLFVQSYLLYLGIAIQYTAALLMKAFIKPTKLSRLWSWHPYRAFGFICISLSLSISANDLRLSPFCELYQNLCAEVSWAPFPSCPFLYQLL